MKALLPVDEAVRRLLADVAPLGPETVPLAQAAGRVLAADLAALRTQPPFPASAMDGYAVRADEAQPGARLDVIGVSRAGERFAGTLQSGQAVRIFTGAPVPDGADAILIQENAERSDDRITVAQAAAKHRFIRPAGLDFRAGDQLLPQGRLLDSRAVALAASMGHSALPITRRPVVAILANGDELVQPGEPTAQDQIISSNGVGLCAFVRECGSDPLDLGIAPDREEAIAASVDRAAGADVLVIIGGASVGDHDLVQAALKRKGLDLDFWRIAMRPGKPLMVGRLGSMRVVGLPGNPVSALVCAHVFLKPLLRTFLGQAPRDHLRSARLDASMSANDDRQDYVRARLTMRDGELVVTPFDLQDSSMLATFALADALIVRPAHAAPAAPGDQVAILSL